jgi:hypothetical protein
MDVQLLANMSISEYFPYAQEMFKTQVPWNIVVKEKCIVTTDKYLPAFWSFHIQGPRIPSQDLYTS